MDDGWIGSGPFLTSGVAGESEHEPRDGKEAAG